MGAIDINSEIPSDDLSNIGDWSTFENVVSSSIPRYLILFTLLIITVHLLGIVLRYFFMWIFSSTEPSPINKITPAVSVNSPFQTQVKQVDFKKREINNLLFFKNIFHEYEIIKNKNSNIYLKLIDIDNLFFKLSNKILDSSSPVKLEEFNIFTNRTIDVITGLAKILKNKNDYNNPDERISRANNSLDKIKEILLKNIKNINEEGLKDFEISITLLWTEK